jgi:UDP-N-acetylmuramoyl-tripeptide--D-alanyl-D-alanine ligase
VKFLLSTLATEIDGRLIAPSGEPDASIEVDGVSIDSRSDLDGRLFVPLVAARNGHEFIADAVAKGAAAYLTSQPARTDLAAPAIEVADTSAALTAIGVAARRRLDGPVVGITGSVGKTSVKDLTLAACRSAGPAWASAASFNNELGVPLTLANAPDGGGVTIVEMGARGIGHIEELCSVARPTIGLVTCVALAHSELFGSLAEVARGKGELIEALPPDGTAVLNADDPNVAAMAARTEARVLTFGTAAPADVRLESVTVDRLLRPTMAVVVDGERVEPTLQVRGAHMALNATAALAAALAAGVPLHLAVEGLVGAGSSRWRMEVLEAPGGALVVNDAYNANPTSMRAALRALGELEAERRVAVVGVMAELGEEGPAEHRAIVDEALAVGIEVVAVDAPAYGDRARHVTDRDAARLAVGPLGPGDAVLVKGSRVAQLERLVTDLVSEPVGGTR